MLCGPVVWLTESPDLGVLGGEASRERSEQTADEYPEAGGVCDEVFGREAKKIPAEAGRVRGNC